jgi:hypothetical protein
VFGFVALTGGFPIGEARGQWHIGANENIHGEKRHGRCETGAGWRGRDFQAVIRKSADAIEARNAFVEKRKARFTGR